MMNWKRIGRENNCSICLTNMNKKKCKLGCNHCFHTKCILKWFEKSNSCPICRQQVNNEIIVDIVVNILNR